MEVTRHDYGRAIGVETTPEGFLRVDAYVARTGVQVYRDADGKERREYRPASAVFDVASLESFHLKPVTLGHPAEGLLSADNAKRYQVGSIGETVKPDRKFVRAKFLVTDGTAIAAIKRGIRELSVGYQATFDGRPGVTDDGQHYDGSQDNIRVNHLAVVESGRAGGDVAIKLDAGAAVMRFDASDFEDKRGLKMANVILDGISYEAAPEVANALTRAQEAVKAAQVKLDEGVKTGSVEADKLRGERDSLKARVDELEKRDIGAAVKARVALETTAAKVLKDAKLDEMSDGEIKAAVIVACFPNAKLDGQSEAYVDGSFARAVETIEAKATADNAINEQRKTTTPPASATAQSKLDEADKKAEERIRNAWKAA